jgi:hypothetical protein
MSPRGGDPRPSGGRLALVRVLDALLATSLFFLAVVVFGGRVELRVASMHLTVGGWLRPLICLLALAALRLLPGVAWSGPRGAWHAALWRVLAPCALAFMTLPLFLPLDEQWPAKPRPTAGWAFLAACALMGAVRLARSGDDARSDATRRLSAAEALLLIGAASYVLFVGNRRYLTSGDNLATRWIAPHVVARGSLDLGDVSFFQREPLHYSAVRIGERILPAFPVGTGLLAIPHAALAAAFGARPFTDDSVARLEKHFAALAMSLAAALFFLTVRRRASDRAALAATAVFALGTTVFTCASQGMYSTTGEVLCLSAALCLVFRARPPLLASAAAGAVLGLAFLCRPSGAAFGAALLVGLAAVRLRAAVAAAFTFVVAVGLSCLWMSATYGHLLGAYGLLNTGVWGHSPGAGLLAALVSPSRGLLVFCPYLLFVPLAWRATGGERETRAFWIASLALVLFEIGLIASYDKWYGGYGLGPRLFTEVSPFLAILVAPLFGPSERLGAWRFLLAACVCFAVLTQLFSAYDPRVSLWDERVMVAEHPRVLWSVRNSQLAAAWRPNRLLDRGGTPPLEEISGDPDVWYHVDLSSVANARYEVDAFSAAGAPAGGGARYPRIDWRPHAVPTSLFHFLPQGRPNAATTCGTGAVGPIRVPSLRCRRLHAVLAAAHTAGPPAAVASWRVKHRGGATEELPIFLDRDVWDYDPSRRAVSVNPFLVYQQGTRDEDVLVKPWFRIWNVTDPVVSIDLVNAAIPGEAGVTLLALTLELE